jgi:quercetin dioxygenase-like cupin family protein
MHKMKNIIGAIFLISFLLITACAGNINNVEVKQLAKSTKSWDGEKLPEYPQGQPEVTILRIKIPAGAELEIHNHPVINAGVLLAGELTVVTEDNKTLHLKAGDSIVELVNKKHYGKNEGADTAEIIVFYAGVENKPITIK